MLGVGRWGPVTRLASGPLGGHASPGATSDAAPGGTARPIGSGSGEIPGDERDAWVVLDSVTGVGPVSFARLLTTFGTARDVLAVATRAGGASALVAAATDPDGGTSTLTPGVARAICDAAAAFDERLEPVRRSGLRVVILADPTYPRRLRKIELPPPVLYVRGSLRALDRPRAVAIVGTRRPTETGRATAGSMADVVASLGATIVSGLAVGIDAAAHAAAVRTGAPTVAVIGGGHGHLYPAGHRGLVEAIVAGGGAVVSEFSPETIPSRGTFPRRNRIISGLSDATIVIEAGIRSGALTTAAWALEQGRELHIVPGRLGDPAVAGSLAFLREAGPDAHIVVGIPELVEDLAAQPAWRPPQRRGARLAPDPAGGADRTDSAAGSPAGANALLAALPAVERSIAAEVADGRSSVDALVAATGLGGATILGALTALEMRGLVVEAFGQYRPAGTLASGGSRKPSVLPRSRCPRERRTAPQTRSRRT